MSAVVETVMLRAPLSPKSGYIDGKLFLTAEAVKNKKKEWIKQLKRIEKTLPYISVCNTNLPQGLGGKKMGEK